jgi:hypothetical protein
MGMKCTLAEDRSMQHGLHQGTEVIYASFESYMDVYTSFEAEVLHRSAILICIP